MLIIIKEKWYFWMKIVVWIYIHLCVCQKHFYALWVVTYHQPKYILNYSDYYLLLVVQAQLKWGTSEFPNLSIYWIASTIVIVLFSFFPIFEVTIQPHRIFFYYVSSTLPVTQISVPKVSHQKSMDGYNHKT